MTFYGNKDNGTRRILLIISVVFCHICAILIPGCSLFRKKEVKENAFRVKLGEVELNSGPVVGPPERTPPGKPAAPEPETPDEPEEPPAPVIPPKEPETPAVPREPVIPKPKPQPKPKPKKTLPKPKPKKPAAKPKAKPKVQPKKPAAKPKNPKDDGVYRPDSKQTEIGKGYGQQNNARIPIGSRDAAQKYGKKFDNRPPGGGASESMEKYGKNLVRYLKSRWTYPPKSLLGGKMPSVLIELDIAPGGRVLGKRIIKRSGVNAMDQSIERMLDQLEQVPSPPDKKITLEILMQMSDD